MMNDALTVFFSRGPFREKNLSIPAAAGSSPSMPLLVFWPLLAPRRWRYFSALRSAFVRVSGKMKDLDRKKETENKLPGKYRRVRALLSLSPFLCQ